MHCAARIAGLHLTFILCAASGQSSSEIDPQKALWQTVKRQLLSQDGDEYFNSSMKDAQIPALKGAVISTSSQNPNDASTSLEIAVAGSTIPEATLILRGDAARAGAQLKNAASIEFSGVATSFTKNPFRVVFMAEQALAPMPGLGAMAATWYFGPNRTSARNGRFHGPGVEFDLPAGWSLRGTRLSAASQVLAVLENSQFQGVTAAAWIKREKTSAGDIPGEVQKLFTDLNAQRSDLAHYAIRPASLRLTWIGGKQSIQAVADYESGGQLMSETLTGIVTERSKVVFFARTVPARMAELQAEFDKLVYTALVQ